MYSLLGRNYKVSMKSKLMVDLVLKPVSTFSIVRLYQRKQLKKLTKPSTKEYDIFFFTYSKRSVLGYEKIQESY